MNKKNSQTRRSSSLFQGSGVVLRELPPNTAINFRKSDSLTSEYSLDGPDLDCNSDCLLFEYSVATTLDDFETERTFSKSECFKGLGI